MDIIGLNGRKGVGKDTAGDYLVSKYGFTRVSFAGLLKQSAAALFNVSVDFWECAKNDPHARVILTTLGADGYTDDVANITVRQFLQRYGTEAHRDVFGTDFWVDAIFTKLYDESGPFVFTDARFDNELREIRRWGGINIRIMREGEDTGDAHASEADPDMSLINAIIDNAGTIEELYLSIDAVVAEVWEPSRVK